MIVGFHALEPFLERRAEGVETFEIGRSEGVGFDANRLFLILEASEPRGASEWKLFFLGGENVEKKHLVSAVPKVAEGGCELLDVVEAVGNDDDEGTPPDSFGEGLQDSAQRCLAAGFGIFECFADDREMPWGRPWGNPGANRVVEGD